MVQNGSGSSTQTFEAFPDNHVAITITLGACLITAVRRKETVKFVNFVENEGSLKKLLGKNA